MSYPMVTFAKALETASIFTDGDWVESKDQDPDGDVRLVQLADVGDGEYLRKSARFLTGTKAKELRCTFLIKGDILIARMPDPLGRACIFPGDLKNAVTVVDVCVIRPDPKVHCARWLMHCINGIDCRRKISALSSGTTRTRISRGNLSEIEIPLPPLPEQRRIADILDRADALRAKRRAALARLDELTQAIFVEMFGDPVSNPKGWPIKTLGEHADIQGGIQVSVARKSLPVEVPYLRVANVHRGRLDLSEIKRIQVTPSELTRTTLKKNDLLVVEGHGNRDEIGRVALWDGSVDPCIHQNHLIRVRPSCGNLLPSFACDYLNSPGGRQHLLKSGKSTTGLNTISTSEVRAAPIALPPVAAQQLYVNLTAAVYHRKTLFTSSINHLDALFASLQDRAFRGAL